MHSRGRAGRHPKTQDLAGWIAGNGADHDGFLDSYLHKAKADALSPRALDLKRAIQKKVGKPAPVAKAS